MQNSIAIKYDTLGPGNPLVCVCTTSLISLCLSFVAYKMRNLGGFCDD